MLLESKEMPSASGSDQGRRLRHGHSHDIIQALVRAMQGLAADLDVSALPVSHLKRIDLTWSSNLFKSWESVLEVSFDGTLLKAL